MAQRLDIIKREVEIRQWIDDHISKREIARRLNCDIKTVDRVLSSFGISYSGKRGWSRGLHRDNKLYMTFDEYVSRNNVALGTNKIRIKLLRDGIKLHRCEQCGNTEWQGVPIPLEVHHINGNRRDNDLCNLQLLCPNCHALTPTYRGKNIKKK